MGFYLVRELVANDDTALTCRETRHCAPDLLDDILFMNST